MGLVWPKAVFPYAWFWQEMHASPGFPWYGEVYVMAIEPFTSMPGHGLTRVMEDRDTAYARLRAEHRGRIRRRALSRARASRDRSEWERYGEIGVRGDCRCDSCSPHPNRCLAGTRPMAMGEGVGVRGLQGDVDDERDRATKSHANRGFHAFVEGWITRKGSPPVRGGRSMPVVRRGRSTASI